MSRKTQFEVHSAGGQRHQLQPILLEVEVHLKFRFAAGSEEQVPLQSHADGRRNHPDGSKHTVIWKFRNNADINHSTHAQGNNRRTPTILRCPTQGMAFSKLSTAL